MGATKVDADNKPLFTIVNNVLKGQVEELKTNYTNFGSLLLDRMRSNSNLIGQVDAVTEIQDTFADMADRSVKCALWLRKLGVRRGDVVAVSSHNHLDTFIPCLAALYLGATFNPWDYKMNIQLARHFMTLSTPKVIFANEASAGVALEAAKIELLDIKVVTFYDHPGTTPFSDVLKGHSSAEVANFRCAEVNDPQDTAIILYSSGTTGLPKGVQLTYRAFLYSILVKNTFSTEGQVPLWFSTLYWISGTLLTIHTIATSTTRIIAPDYEPEVACKLIEKYKVTWAFFGTSMANRLGKSGYVDKYDLSGLKVLFTGGASLKQEAQNELRNVFPNVQILQLYGLTEVGGVATGQVADSPSGSCGIVGRNSELKIIDPQTGAVLGPNKNGEICIKAQTLTKGYYKNPEATKGAIDEEGWLHTGDLGYYDEDGELYVVDRLKELIKFKGYQVSPCEVEDLLLTHPAVLEVAVVAISHPTDDEHPMAFVSRTPGKKVTEQELMDFVENNLMDYCKLRGGVRFLDSLPHTASGKIARKDIRAMAKAIAT